jgi:hypothetical protein
MKIKSKVKAGALNHNQTRRLPIKSGIKAGVIGRPLTPV